MQVKILSSDGYLTLGLQILFSTFEAKSNSLHLIDVDRVGGLNEIYDYLNSWEVNCQDKVLALTRNSIRSRQFKKMGYIPVASSLSEMRNITSAIKASSTPERWKKELEFYMDKDFLTSRQQEIISLYESGLQSSEISSMLGISVKTLYAHMGRVFTQYHAKNWAEFMFYKNNYASLNSVS